MSSRNEVANWISQRFGSEELLFNLKLTYDKLMVSGVEKKDYSTYSQAKLSFNKACQIAESNQWGIPGEVNEIGDSFEDTEQSRYDVFMGYMRAALAAVAFKVSMAPENSRNKHEVEVALNNTTAGILPYQFGGEYNQSLGLIRTAPTVPASVKGKKGQAAADEYIKQLEEYQKHVKKLVAKAETLWRQKLTFVYNGENKEIRTDLSIKGYLSPDPEDKTKITRRYLWDDEKNKFLDGLMQIFGVGREPDLLKPAMSTVNTATGEIYQIQNTNVFEAYRNTISLAEVLIAVASNAGNILITAHEEGKVAKATFDRTFDKTSYDYCNISFWEEVLSHPTMDWEQYSYTNPLGSTRQNLWWSFAHELLHVYPIYSSEYRPLSSDETVKHEYVERESESGGPGYVMVSPAYQAYVTYVRLKLREKKVPDFDTIPIEKAINKYGLVTWEEYKAYYQQNPKDITFTGTEPGPFESFDLRESPEEDVTEFFGEEGLERKGRKEDRFKKTTTSTEPTFTGAGVDLAKLTNPPPQGLSPTELAQRAWLREWAGSAAGLQTVDLSEYQGADDWIKAWKDAKTRAQAFGALTELKREFRSWVIYQLNPTDIEAFLKKYDQDEGLGKKFLKLKELASNEFGMPDVFHKIFFDEGWVESVVQKVNLVNYYYCEGLFLIVKNLGQNQTTPKDTDKLIELIEKRINNLQGDDRNNLKGNLSRLKKIK